jgi:hypothetical protein
MAAKENFTVTWNEKDEIKLTHDAVVVRRHQNTGDEVRKKNEMWHSSVPTRLLLMIFLYLSVIVVSIHAVLVDSFQCVAWCYICCTARLECTGTITQGI